MTFVAHRRRILAAAEGGAPMAWARALAWMGGFAAVLGGVQLLNWTWNQRLDRFGLYPRELHGLLGVLTSPLLHASWWQLITNTAPFVILGWAVLLSGWRAFWTVTGLVVLAGGLLTWLVAPSGVILGASGVVFGWLGYLVARAVFTRRVIWVIGAAALGFFFSGLFAGLLPSFHSQVAWQGHLASFVAGCFTGWLVHPKVEKLPWRQRVLGS